MDFPRFFVCFFLFLVSFGAYSETPDKNMGIAFVHGTNDHREDADGGYWNKRVATSL